MIDVLYFVRSQSWSFAAIWPIQWTFQAGRDMIQLLEAFRLFLKESDEPKVLGNERLAKTNMCHVLGPVYFYSEF